jgi:hypothetical protein
MSKTNGSNITEKSRPKGVAQNQAEAFELLRSAIWHCQQNGITIKFVNKPLGLWLMVPGARIVTADGVTTIQPIEPEGRGRVIEPVPVVTEGAS